MPAPARSPYKAALGGRRTRLAPLLVGGGLLVVAGVAVPALVGGAGPNLGPAELGFADGGAGSYDGGSYDGTGVGSYEAESYDTYDAVDTAGDTGSYEYDEPVEYEDDSASYDEPEGLVVLPSDESWADGVEDTFDAYFGGINDGDPQSAWLQLSASRQAETSLDEFADAVRTSHDSEVVVQDAYYAGGTADVWLTFTSTQDPALGPNPGEGCTVWSLDYVLVEQVDGTFLIDQVTGHGGTSGHTPC